jgi:hypothetical protein
MSSQCWLPPRPEADQHTRDDPAVDLRHT